MARTSNTQNKQTNGNGNNDNNENHSHQSSSSNQNKNVRQADQEVDWCGFQCIGDDKQTAFVFKQSNKRNDFTSMKDVFILDSGSTIGATVMNLNLVSNICASAKPTIMSTNAGTKILGTNANVPGFRIAKYDPNHMANIFGFSHVADKYRVMYNNSVEDCFNVHTKNGVVKFNRNGRLYMYKPSKEYLLVVKKCKQDENEFVGDQNNVTWE